VPRPSRTPGAIRWRGEALGAHNGQAFGESLGMTAAEIDALREQGVI
jgi:crotonobetainyl-CoA:carnitine CoA-transferase CaiB-like acyl-CoA transferase